jgi:hypothetical protein
MDFASDQGVRAVRDAAQVNAELMGRGFMTAQQAFILGIESTARTFERFAQTMHNAFAGDAGGPAKEVTQNLSAASQAGVGLTISAQEAYKAWVDLTEQRLRTNLEGLGAMVRCRTLQEVASVQTRLMRENLEMTLNTGRAIANASQKNLENAASAIEQSSTGH